MPDWQSYLTATERARIDAIPAERKALTAEYRRYYDRCLKRMKAAIRKRGVNGKQNDGAD